MTGKQTGNYILLQFRLSQFLLMVVLHNISEKKSLVFSINGSKLSSETFSIPKSPIHLHRTHFCVAPVAPGTFISEVLLNLSQKMRSYLFVLYLKMIICTYKYNTNNCKKVLSTHFWKRVFNKKLSNFTDRVFNNRSKS